MKNGIFTFGISSLKQKRDHDEKEWKTERASIPISNFKVETDVKWCPETDEIFYRKPKQTGMFEPDWKEISQYSDLYEKLLVNFRRKYQRTSNTQTNRTKWTRASR